jgi:hypothetical protein
MDEFKKSDSGTKAAWKGFSSQTTYIAYRLMILEDDAQFYPEKIEDLMIKSDGVIKELVQVKNLTTDLALSHLSPKEPDSFFRRALACKSESPNLKLRVISFGNIGKELLGLSMKESAVIQTIESKLLDYGYKSGDCNWLLERLEIEHIGENVISQKIFDMLSNTIQTIAAPDIAFDVLTSYVSKLSKNGENTSKEIWKLKLHDMAMGLAAISGFQAQYGRSIRPLFDSRNRVMVVERLE